MTMLECMIIGFVNRLRTEETGDGWTYILVILGVLVLTAILVLAFVGPLRTQITTLMNNVISYFSSMNSNITTGVTV